MRHLAIIVSLFLAALFAGCGSRKPSSKEVAEQLQKSFDVADAAARGQAAQVASAFQSGDYTRAIREMDRLAQTRQVSAAQKQAVGTLIQQTRQATQRNPSLNTPELYKAISDLTVRVYGEN